jgi:hypothetical protein
LRIANAPEPAPRDIGARHAVLEGVEPDPNIALGSTVEGFTAAYE